MEADCFQPEVLLVEMACRLTYMGSLCRLGDGSDMSGAKVWLACFVTGVCGAAGESAAAQVKKCLVLGKNTCCCHLSTKHSFLGGWHLNSCKMNSSWAALCCSTTMLA